MRRPPPLTFSSARVRTPEATRFEVQGGTGRIELRGGLSAGSAGWELSAAARWHRRVINVYVTARQAEPNPARDVEDHGYVATLEVPPGWYHLRLNHVYIFADSVTPTPGLAIYERSVWVR